MPAPKSIPKWVANLKSNQFILKADHNASLKKPYASYIKELARLDNLFEVKSGIVVSGLNISLQKLTDNYLPLVRPSKTQQTSYVKYVDTTSIDSKYIYPRHTLYVSTNGQGSHTYAYVSPFEFVPNSDVSVLVPRRKLSLQEKLFYAHAISVNRKWYSYGRKPKGNRLKSLKLPKFPPPFVYESNIFKEILQK